MTHDGHAAQMADLSICLPFYRELFQEFKRVLAPDGCLYWFCDWRSYAFYFQLFDEIKPRNLIVWDKRSGCGSFYTNEHELIIFATNNNGLRLKSARNIIREIPSFSSGAKKTNGEKIYVWRNKGTFNIPDQTNTTENNSTDANGQELVFTGISTTHKFTKTGEGCKAVVVDVAKDLADVSAFFDEVVTPDTLTAKTAYTLSVSQAANTTVTVKKGDATIANGATIHAGDVLQISVTGGTITVNGTGFISGDMHVVTGNVAVVSTASA